MRRLGLSAGWIPDWDSDPRGAAEVHGRRPAPLRWRHRRAVDVRG